MKLCLCCLKPLKNDNTQYHPACLKKLFNTSSVPKIELNEDILQELAKKTTQEGITVQGVQKKLSLHLISDRTENRLTLIGHPQGYILKPQSSDFNFLPEIEQITMCMAVKAKIQTPPHALIYVNNQTLAYIIKRMDRNEDGTKNHMEDLCQLSERLTEDKYKGSYEQCAKIIQKYSNQPLLDISDFYYRLLFCFITGNSDMHLKNFSLIQNTLNEWKLADAYDLLSVNLVLKADKEETALTLNGKKSKIQRNDFLTFAKNCKIPEKAATKMINQILSFKEDFISIAKTELLPSEMQTDFINLIEDRCYRLEA